MLGNSFFFDVETPTDIKDHQIPSVFTSKVKPYWFLLNDVMCFKFLFYIYSSEHLEEKMCFCFQLLDGNT